MKKRKVFLKKEEILKEFQTILALEEDAAKSYQQLAQDCGDPVARAMLEEIAREEWTHVAIAQKLVNLAVNLVPQEAGPKDKVLHINAPADHV